MEEKKIRIKNRETLRLQGFDYGSDGAYFVTIQSQHSKRIFSRITNGSVILNDIGKIIEEEWLNTSVMRSYVTLDEFVIMPGHFHGILFIHKDSEEPDHLRPTGTYLHFPEGYQNSLGPQIHNLASIIRGFKAAVTRELRLKGNQSKIWQGRYFERIIRNEKELDKFRLYIKNNPHKWGLEDDHPFISTSAA